MKKIDIFMMIIIIIALFLSDHISNYATITLEMPSKVQLAILGLIVLIWFIIRIHMFLKKYSD